MPGLTKAQALAYVQQGLAWRSDKSTEIATMFDVVQYDELEQGTSPPWFLLTLDEALSGTANVPTLTLPTNYWKHYDEGGVYYTTDDGPRRYLRKRSQDWIIENNQDPSDGSVDDEQEGPFYYALVNRSIYISPVPTVAFTLYTNYYKHAATYASLADGGQNEWLQYASSLICNLVGVRMAEDLQHGEAEAKFQKRFNAANARLMAETVDREMVDNEFSMGNQV